MVHPRPVRPDATRRSAPRFAWRPVAVWAALLALPLAPATAQPRADASLELTATRYGEFEETAGGVGARLGYRVLDWLAVDGGVVFAPGELGEPGFSGSQLEGLFGLRAGPRFGEGGVYAAVRPGFVRFSAAPEPFACIAIFPPPLECTLAQGRTVLALSLGAGGEIPVGARGLVRLELSDLLLKLPGPALARDEAVLEESFWRHDLRMAVSVGLRF